MAPNKRNAERTAFRRCLKQVRGDWKGERHSPNVRRKTASGNCKM